MFFDLFTKLRATLRAERLYFKLFVADIRAVKRFANRSVSYLLLALIVAGCATSTVDKRKQERSSAYAALPPETRELVDKGQIKIGMPMDAVYIALGKPAQIINGQSSDGSATTIWLYHGTTWHEYRYWNYHYYPHGRYGYYPTPTLDYDYVPHSYLAAEVVFQNGVVKSWRNSSQPQPY